MTSREREVLALIVRGKTNKVIAHELGVTESTVKQHAQRIYKELGVRNRAQAIAKTLGGVV